MEKKKTCEKIRASERDSRKAFVVTLGLQSL